eukprot:gnl/TRDRNA2_/TRDRNA2_41107_c0_seq1.p1 gnl/TRDRNA2_/TRDRNA2_41107_c0~~gnl/TRDRNA2_/TRDRNA2_41107_c0_seq1.p1  ORF type:complete len:224 (+),score=53.95 gnl/TRDRNA2_/TRDRNA2_41107_c0_seq1:85-756(+)
MGQGLSGVKDTVRSHLPCSLGSAQKDRGSGGSSAGAPGVPGAGLDVCQYTVAEAVSLQSQILKAVQEEQFQKLLKRAQALHPRRGVRGHPDQEKFVTQLQGLLKHVYGTILTRPPWNLDEGWQGVRQMMSKMVAVADDKKVVAVRDQINEVLGLPRGAVLRPPPEEPLFVPTPDGSGPVPTYSPPLLTDTDGDQAHEFWEESREAGGGIVLKKLKVCSSKDSL